MIEQNGPQRIVYLTGESAETLFLLGEDWRIVGISGFTSRPKEVLNRPRISTFTSAKIEQILELKPDLAIGYSKVQAQIAQDLIKAGVDVLVFNQQSVDGALQAILTIARIVAAESRGLTLVAELREGLARIAESASRFPRRPRVYFEEWMDPLISGIGWVEELIELAGGENIFPHLRGVRDAKRRAVTAEEVIAANPEAILASWCGRKVDKDKIRAREGWGGVEALRSGHVYEVKSSYILQPGPGALTEGVRQLHAILASVVNCAPVPGLAPSEALDPDVVQREADITC
jgi:iron complex transport system substrate-binding protein